MKLRMLGRAVAALILLTLVACGSESSNPVQVLDDSSFAFSEDIQLTAEEREADIKLKAQRQRFRDRYAQVPGWPFNRPFAEWRGDMTQDELYQTLKKMPKGGMLHIHATATGDAAWIVDRALAEPGSYIYWGPPSENYARGQLAFFPGQAIPEWWIRVSDLKRSMPDLRTELLALYTLGPEDANLPDIWKEFETIFQRVDGFLSFRPVFMDYYTDAFQILARDGVQFLELRTSVDSLIDEHGQSIAGDEVLRLYRSILAAVRTQYPEFDLRLIICSFRGASLQWTSEQMDRTKTWMSNASDLVTGFDIVGNEYGGHSNAFYASVFTANPAVPLFLHGGESLSLDNNNVRDAFMLGAKRISHALNLIYFPSLEVNLRQSGVMLEVCPISNQALQYVTDLRLHPARGFLQRGLQCTLGSDDPAIFGSTGITDDFWIAYIAWGLDLRSLKKLAINSIMLSSLSPEQKQKQLNLFQYRWKSFISETVNRL